MMYIQRKAMRANCLASLSSTQYKGINYSCTNQDMKQDLFPIFYKNQDSASRQIEPITFIQHLSAIRDSQTLITNLKPIEQNLRLLSKQPHNQEPFLRIVSLLCKMFQSTPLPQILILAKTLINADVKFEAKRQPTDDVLNNQENVRTTVSDQPIALPYAPEGQVAYGPQLPEGGYAGPVIALHNQDAMTDVCDQKKQGDSKTYFIEDNQKVSLFLEKPFKVIKREGISELFTLAAEVISSELMESYLENNFILLPLPSTVELLKLLDYISPALYSFHLLNIARAITEQFHRLLEQKQTEKNLSKDLFSSISSTFNSIAERWVDYTGFSIEQWNWQVDHRMISLFIKSQVSQKKLFAVKTLGEICRKSTYFNYTVNPEKIKEFIANKGILDEILRPDNHPEVIAKGQQVFLYMTKDGHLNKYLINLIFSLLQKCHQNLSKSLFATLQKVEENNIKNYREHLLQKIEQLPRPNCFNQETFALIKRIILVTPAEEVEVSLKKIYRIIEKNYDKLRENLKKELITLYYQVFVMGIEMNIFNENNPLTPLKAILNKPQANLYLHMIQAFIYRLKDKTYHQNYGHKCRKTLHEGIKQLIRQEKIHQLRYEDSTQHLNILMLLLENYEQMDNQLLSHEELWNLIKIDNKFTKFIRYYPEVNQIEMISSLIKIEHKSSHDLQCIIDLYHLMTNKVRQTLAPLLTLQFYKSNQLIEKYILAPEVLEIEPLTFQEVIDKTEQEKDDPLKMVSWLILARQILKKQDEKGYGKIPPFQFLANTYDVEIKVTRYSREYKQNELNLSVKSYDTLFEIASQILTVYSQTFDKTKIKLNDKYLQFADLKKRISSMTGYRKVTIEVYETEESEWIDKSQLLDKDNLLRLEVSDCLTEIYKKFETDGKLDTEGIAGVFKVATQNDYISKYDSRVNQIITLHSNNGQTLTLEEWLNFWYQSSEKNAPLVVSNLTNLGYGNIFIKATSFQDQFKSDHSLRASLASDSKQFKMLFSIYRDTVSKCPNTLLKSQLTDELIKTLNLLPIDEGLMSAILEQSQSIFEDKENVILHWYISVILKSIYFQDFKIEDYSKWRSRFIESANFQNVKLIYIKYLELILLEGSEEFINNNRVVISILENLGRITRETLLKIPNLININLEELAPLTPADIDPFLQITILNFSEAVEKLAALCVTIAKVKGNVCILENSLAVVSHLILKRSQEGPVGALPVIESMIFNPKQSIRSIFNSFYYLLAITVPSIKEGYYSLHISSKSRDAKHCKQYFNVFSKILRYEQSEDKYNQISKIFQRDIAEYSPEQSVSSLSETDEVLLGKLKIVNYIKLYNPKTVIEPSTVQSIKQLLETNSSEEVREILYSMSNEVCDFQTNITIIAKIMNNVKLSRNSKLRGRDKMGILNLGCICYINSVIQQLEMIEPFKVGIISTEISTDPHDFFSHFQHLFYQLTFGQRIYLIPQNFCLNYLDSNGNPVNTKQQHDADEFLNQLFDRLQTRLKGSKEQSLVSDNFKGEVVNVISCDRCFQKKERIETFYILSMEIKNLKSLQECINKYAETQIICDYFCETCDTKVETIQKYHRFQSLPPFFFIHLQRLVFDLQSLYKIKLDHSVQFPHQIDLTEFFNQECSQPVQYTLKGFVVHVGGSEGGHYYSIIKCDGQWIKFDDTRIDPWQWQGSTHDKSNAYMLIYQRKIEKGDEKGEAFKIGNPSLMEEIKDDNFTLLKEKIFLQPSFTKYVLQSVSKMHIPEQFSFELPQLLKPYHERFTQLPVALGEQFDSLFFVLLQYFKLETRSRQLNLFGNSNEMQDHNIQHHKQHSQLQKIAIYLMYILHFRPQFAVTLAKEFITETDNNMFLLIYNHRDQQVRQIIKTILLKIFIIIKSDLYTNFMVLIPQNELIQKLLQKIIVALCEVGKNPNKMLSFFELVFDLFKRDRRFGEWFQCNKLGPRLIHFLMGSDSSLSDVFPAYPLFLTMARKQQSISVIVEILIELTAYEKDLSVEMESNLTERKAYLNFQFMRRLFQDRYDNQRLPTLLNFCSRNNPDFTNKIITFVIQNLNRFSHTDQYIIIYINVLYHQLILKDDLSRERTERLLGVPLPWKKSEKEGEEYMIVKETDRFCRYENSSQRKGDEIILSFLELLYVNRKEQNYFVYFGIVALLELMTSSPEATSYVESLPGPCPKYPSYTDWIIEFVYESQKLEKETHQSLTPEQKSQVLKKIASLINKFENVESDSGENASERTLHHNINNKPYHQRKISNTTEWIQIQLCLGKNLKVKDPFPSDIQPPKESQFATGKFRFLFGSDEQGQESIELFEFELSVYCRMKVYFTAGYPYTFHLEKGFYQFALPFFEDQLNFMVCETEEGELSRVLSKKKEKESMKMEIQEKPKLNGMIEEEFPSIAEVYQNNHDQQMAANDTRMKEELPPDTIIECPFCGFKSKKFTRKCQECHQDWGQMA